MVRTNREDRVAKFEWDFNGGPGRAVIGKVREGAGSKEYTRLADPDQSLFFRERSRYQISFALTLAPRCVTSTWPSLCDAHRMIRGHELSMRPTDYNIVGVRLLAHLTLWYVPRVVVVILHPLRIHSQLEDTAGYLVAFFRHTRPTRYQIGDVHGELHFIRNAGAGTIVSFLSGVMPYTLMPIGSLDTSTNDGHGCHNGHALSALSIFSSLKQTVLLSRS